MTAKELIPAQVVNIQSGSPTENIIYLNGEALGKHIEIEFGFKDSQFGDHIEIWIENDRKGVKYGMRQYQIEATRMMYRPGLHETNLNWEVLQVKFKSAEQSGASGQISVIVRDIT